MLFAIDENKVKELLTSAEHRYTVAVAPGGAALDDLGPSKYGAMSVSGTVAAVSNSTTQDARKHLMAIRRKIETSGAPLKSVGALAEEIDEMRRR